MRHKSRPYAIAAAILLIAALAAEIAFYRKARPRLASVSETVRLQQIEQMGVPEDSPRAGMTAVREFFLDYPATHVPSLRLQLAASVAAQKNADFLFVASQVEQVAANVLSRFGPGQTPHQADFEKAGFTFLTSYGWTPTFLTADVDGDGSPDVLFAFPTEYSPPGVCYLFRHTRQGWAPHCLALGAPIIGLWIFDIAKGGPKAIEIASLADSQYDPNLFVDVFVSREGRMENVLAARISHGFQLDHKDIDGDGLQEIRLFGGRSSDLSSTAKHVWIYKWNGRSFVLRQGGSTSLELTPWKGDRSMAARPQTLTSEDFALALSQWEALLFDQKAYTTALAGLQSLEGCIRASDLSAEDKTDLLLEIFYQEAICYRKLGQTQRSAIAYAAIWRGYPQSVWGQLARRWLAFGADR